MRIPNFHSKSFDDLRLKRVVPFRHNPTSIQQELLKFSFSREKRFTVGSIYAQMRNYKVKQRQVSEGVNQLILKIKSSWLEVQKQFQKKIKKFKKDYKQGFITASTPERKIQSLHQRCVPSVPHDRYGFPCQLPDNVIQRVRSKKQTLKLSLAKKRSFGYAQRIDFQRPQNFYPGPGAYFYNPNKEKRSRLRKCSMPKHNRQQSSVSRVRVKIDNEVEQSSLFLPAQGNQSHQISKEIIISDEED